MTIRKPTEADVLRACLQLLAVRGVFAWRNNSGNVPVGNRLVRLAPPGTPDILGILPGGRLLAVEVKTATGKLRPSQRAWAEAARGLGAAVLLARSAGELDDQLKDLLRGPTL